MSHRVAHRKLGRKTEHRIATLRNLASSLFEHERIETTLFKAKDLRPFAERMITRAKTGTVHARRIVGRHLHDRDVIKRLFDDIAPRFMDRPGGYTRIVRTMPRKGDAAEMAIIELVVRKEKEAAAPEPKGGKKSKSALGSLARRLSSRGKGKGAEPKQESGS